jgi:hypothetical protein
MTDEFEVKVGSFGMTFNVPQRSGEFVNYKKQEVTEVSLRDIVDLGISVERGLWRITDRLLLDRGREVLSRLQRENPHVSPEDIFQQVFEMIPSGETADDGGSSSRWILAFVQENKDHPELITRLFCALKARGNTVRDFFLAYVYSNTDNIAANLHFFDYLRAYDCEHSELLSSDSDLPRTAKALLADMRHDLLIKEACPNHQALWRIVEEQSASWNEEDVLALERLSRLVQSSGHFVSLAAVAQSVRPLAMFHFHHYLMFAGAREWLHVLRSDREFSADGLRGYYRVVDVALAGLLGEYCDAPTTCRVLLSLADVEEALKLLAVAPQGGLAHLIVKAIDYSAFPVDGAERLVKVLGFIVAKAEIEQHALAARSLQ